MKNKVYKIKLRKHDLVVVTTGRYRGQQGRIVATHPQTNQVTIENLNLVKKHVKPSQTNPQGGIIELHKPLSVSKVALLDSKTKKPSRVAWQIKDDGTKERIYRSSGQVVATAPAAKTPKKVASKS